MRLHHARTGIEFAVQACAGKEWTPDQVHELATAFSEMMDTAYDPAT
jgi:DNA-binding FadR family transcriptional regulator